MAPTGAKEDDIASIDISSVAGNAPDLHFRFHFSGAQEGYWAIDDIELRTIDSVDLRAVSVDWGTTGDWGVRMPYYSMVMSQIQPIEFCVTASNLGLLDIDSVIYDISSPLIPFASSEISSIDAAEIDTICSPMTFLPDPNGIINSTFYQSISTPSNESNLLDNQFDTINFTLDLGWSAHYARDDIYSAPIGGINAEGLYDYQVGNVFDCYHGESFTHIGVWISPDAQVGSEIEGAVVYKFDTTLNEFIAINQSFWGTVETNDLGTIKELGLASPFDPEDATYLVTVWAYGDLIPQNGSSLFGTSGKSKPNTSFFIDGSSGGWEWYHLTETPIVRLITYPHGLNEYESNFNLTVAPNPSNESTTLSFELPSSSPVNFQLIDLSGKVVQQIDPILFSEGENTFELSTENLTTGVYLVKFHSDFGSATKRIIVQH